SRQRDRLPGLALEVAWTDSRNMAFAGETTGAVRPAVGGTWREDNVGGGKSTFAGASLLRPLPPPVLRFGKARRRTLRAAYPRGISADLAGPCGPTVSRSSGINKFEP